MKLKFLKMKRLLLVTMIATSMIATNGTSIFAAQKLYDQVTREVVTKGVDYEKNHRLTADGWQDIHVLRINLRDSNIKIAPVESATEYGLKETVLKLVTDSGAVAGVNASFFGMSGNYSASFGPIVKDGELISAGTDINSGKNEYATFFVDNDGNPFIEFFKINLQFLVNGQSYFDISSVNKVTDMKYPMYFDKNAAESTASLDARFPDLAKIIVENNVITRVSAKGETVQVPENGYLIIMSGTTYDYNIQNFPEGTPVEFKMNGSLDLDKIQTGISGAGKIMVNGVQAENPGLVLGKRQPRTALGISQDKNTLLLMTVDGRGDSIGATQEEMVGLMKEYGAYDAMHFDGGGSTTMVANTIEDEVPEVKNKVSDGAQRKVINSLGVFNNAPVGQLSQIVVKTSSPRVFKGSPVGLQVIGYDEYFRKIEIPSGSVVFESDDESGVFDGYQFIPSKDGKIVITARLEGMSAVTNIEGMTLASVKPHIENLNLQVGQSAELSFTGISTEGFESSVSNLEVSSELGTYSNNIFTATTEGAGYIKCGIGNAVCYIKLTVGANGASVEVPKPTEISDVKRTKIEGIGDGSFYITMAGTVSSGNGKINPNTYNSRRNEINNKMQQNTNLAVYAGKSDISTQNTVETIRWNSGYQFYEKNGVSIVQLTAANGTMRTSNAWQWQAFKNDVLKSTNKNVIFMMDKTPSSFSDGLEAELFRNVLSEIRNEGKNIFVVSASGSGSWSSIKEGIRYINLPDLWNADGSVNENFKLLKFKVTGDTMQYDIQNAF